MFQIDMIGRNEEHAADPREGFLRERASDNANAINLIGSAFSSDIREIVESANDQVGLDLRFRYDYGAQNLIRRSDHWTFLSREVPSLFFFGGLHPDYHTPNDTADKINYPKIESVVRLVYLALHQIGSAPGRPVFANPAE
jgi:Zn-dependent M28 family amino/carboxypeptidase